MGLGHRWRCVRFRSRYLGYFSTKEGSGDGRETVRDRGDPMQEQMCRGPEGSNCRSTGRRRSSMAPGVGGERPLQKTAIARWIRRVAGWTKRGGFQASRRGPPLTTLVARSSLPRPPMLLAMLPELPSAPRADGDQTAPQATGRPNAIESLQKHSRRSAVGTYCTRDGLGSSSAPRRPSIGDASHACHSNACHAPRSGGPVPLGLFCTVLRRALVGYLQ